MLELFYNPLDFGLILVGAIYLFVGIILKKFPPKKINSLYGYRTSSSMKSQERWDFAQTYSAKQMICLGIVLCLLALPGTLLLSAFPLGMTTSLIIFMVLLLLSCVWMFVKTEHAIKRKFSG